MHMITMFSEHNEAMETGELFTFYFVNTRDWKGVLDFQRKHYPEFENIGKNYNSLIFKKVR